MEKIYHFLYYYFYVCIPEVIRYSLCLFNCFSFFFEKFSLVPLWVSIFSLVPCTFHIITNAYKLLFSLITCLIYVKSAYFPLNGICYANHGSFIGISDNIKITKVPIMSNLKITTVLMRISILFLTVFKFVTISLFPYMLTYYINYLQFSTSKSQPFILIIHSEYSHLP